MSRIDNDDSSTNTPFFDESLCQTATLADLDREQVDAFLQEKRVHRQDEYRADDTVQQQMEALGLARGNHPSNGALLCFGRDPSRQITGACLRCSDTSSSGHLEEKNYQVSLLKQFAEAREFLQKRLNFGRVIERGGSSEQPEFPSSVLEEALANALVHCEYGSVPDQVPGTGGVKVEVSRDYVKISNPSGIHPAQPLRNPQIMRFFYLAGYAENTANGIVRMQQQLQVAGLQQPDIELDPHTHTFSIVLHRQVVTDPDPEISGQTLNRAWKEATPLTLPIASNITLGTPFQARYLIWTVLSIIIIVALVFGSGVAAFTVLPQWYMSTFVPPATTIEIASELPTSGVDKIIGLPVQNGVQMAIDDANTSNVLPGYTFKLTAYDDVGKDNRHDPLVGVSNLNKAIADNLVAGVVGPYNSAVAEAELPVANQAAIALLSPSNTYPCLTKDAHDDPDCSRSSNIKAQMRPSGQLTYFRLATTDDREGKAAADFFAVQHHHNVLLLEDDSDVYSSGLAQVFQQEWKQRGGITQLLKLQERKTSIQDYQTVLQKATVSFQPDLIYFAGNDPNGTFVIQALSNIPQLKSVIFAGASGIMDNSFLQQAVQLHRNTPVYASSPIQDPASSGQVGTGFELSYNARRYTDYRPYAASGYDCTMILIQAIKIALQKKHVSTPHGRQDQFRVRQFRQAILQALVHLHYIGATGAQSFDANGDTTNHTISFYQLNPSTPQANWTWLQQTNG